MKACTRLQICCLLVGTINLLGRTIMGAAPEINLAPDIHEALEEQSRILNPLTIEWQVRRESRHRLGRLLKLLRFPDHERNFLEPVRVLARFQDEKMRLRTDYSSVQMKVSDRPKFAGLTPATQEFSYDGTRCFNGSPDLGRVLGITYLKQAVQRTGNAQLMRSNLFPHVGLTVPTTVAEIASGVTSPRSRVAHLLESGGTLDGSEMVDLDGVRCLRLELRYRDRFEVFFLDPSLGYAVRQHRIEIPANSKRQVQTIATSNEFQEVDKTSGFSIATMCRVDYFQFGNSDTVSINTPLFTERYSVSRIDRGPIDDSEFVLVYTTPGTYIADATLPGAEHAPDGQVEYEIPVDPRDLDRVIELAIRRYVPEESVWFPVFLWTFVTAVVVFAIWSVYRRRRVSF